MEFLLSKKSRTRKKRKMAHEQTPPQSLKNKPSTPSTPSTSSNPSRNTTQKVFKKSDYKSGDGMLTSVWGPGLWHYLHTMSFNYPVEPTEQQKRHYRQFMLSLVNVLPCRYCRENLKKNYKKMPLLMSHMASRDTFSRYVYELHEHVNRMLGKKSGLTYCDVRERYEHFRARCVIDPKHPEKSALAPSATASAPSTSTSAPTPATKEKEKGCTEPLYGKKAKCVIKIVPFEQKAETLTVDERCLKKRDLDAEYKNN